MSIEWVESRWVLGWGASQLFFEWDFAQSSWNQCGVIAASGCRKEGIEDWLAAINTQRTYWEETQRARDIGQVGAAIHTEFGEHLQRDSLWLIWAWTEEAGDDQHVQNKEAEGDLGQDVCWNI